VPRLLGISERMEARPVEGSDKPKILPNERVVGAGVLKVVSTGFLVDEDTALMWRGLMLTKAVEQFLRDVQWGDLDYLLIDMPPGTGDVQMGLARMLPSTSLIVVTTPALAAQKVAQRAADMARRSFLEVIGVIENMSAFTCDHGESYALFGDRWRPGTGGRHRGATARARYRSRPRWRRVVTPAIRCALAGTGAAADEFRSIAEQLRRDIAPPAPPVDVDMAGCTAREFDTVTPVDRRTALTDIRSRERDAHLRPQLVHEMAARPVTDRSS
jgi:ATP-binding protein involved in chromosome partitioning